MVNSIFSFCVITRVWQLINIKKFNFLGPQAVFMKENERNQVINNVSEYISKNYKTILKENLKYMPKDLIEFLKTVPDSGIKEIGLN